MNTAKKRLAAALKKTDSLPEHWFGTESASMEELPSVRRRSRVRKNIFIEQETVDALEGFCKARNVPFTDVANDILRSFVDKQRKKSAG